LKPGILNLEYETWIATLAGPLVDRTEHYFLFDSHYALAKTHWQQVATDGHAKLVVMEALKCPLPNANNGEDNAVFKSLIGTLIKCPGPGHCADPLMCKAGFFQVTVPESSKQTDESELPDWIDDDPMPSCPLGRCPLRKRFAPRKCPLRISRRTHADNVASSFSCRLQWKARRAEIDCLGKQAADLCETAKRIAVLADTTLFRAYGGQSAAQSAPTDSAALPVHTPPNWRLLVCLQQIWMTKSGQAFPPCARIVLDYMGHSIHHPHQISLAQFCAHHLGQVIYNLDMLAIARTTKLTATSKEKVEDETTEEVKTRVDPVVEFYGGEQTDEPEDEEAGAGSWRPSFFLFARQIDSYTVQTF